MSAGAEGGCTCGQVRYRLLDDPIVVHCCHCRWCQRESGSAFALNAVIEADRVELIGESAPERIDTPSLKADFIRVGTLDDPDICPPDVHVFTESKQPWVMLSESAERFEQFYSGKDVTRIYGENGAARWRILRGR
ncbi:hypothetical protein EDF56_101514 [Novosphingobium sp. PhB165]|uniref:GFA family protein n=1 Tax=Novosphingobium sp. PhB165 TaxID=2485105 RepID=UPI00104BB9CA|nr:GFA family protein [Novosphingobium sp. PhB165]TCM21838.1 hypothetical protein EDF56_101514 [Novosphingobium sp. PhB165]